MEADDPLLPRSTPKIECQEDGDCLIVSIREPSLDFAHSARLRELLRELVDGRERVAIDISAVHHVDTFGFQSLLAAVWHCPGVLRFRGARRPVRSLFELAELSGLIGDDLRREKGDTSNYQRRDFDEQ